MGKVGEREWIVVVGMRGVCGVGGIFVDKIEFDGV